MKTRAVAIPAVVLAACLVAAGCRTPAPRGGEAASAVIAPKSKSRLTGKATFTRLSGAWVHCRVEIAGVEPGPHAVHLHEFGDCSAPDAMTAGGHWNPAGRRHGRWGQWDGEFHLGDLGNIEIGPDGRGSLDLTTDLWTIGDGGPTDILWKSVVVHAKADDFTTQPTGNAGDRIGCGPVMRSGR